MVSPASALESIRKEGVLIDASLKYQNQNISMTANKSQILDKNLNTWVPLSDSSEGITLLGKLAEISNEKIELELMVLDSSQTPNIVSSNINLIAISGQKMQTTLATEAGSIICISFTASNIPYWEYPGATPEDVIGYMKH